MNLDDILDQIYLLPETSKLKLKNLAEEIHLSKGHILIQSDKVEGYVYLIEQGLVRAYTKTADRDITFWFGKEGDIIISMKSYVLNLNGYEDIELLENSKLHQLPVSSLKQLFSEDVHLANWGRIFAEKELVKTEERLISRQFRTAKERYQELINHNPDLLQRIKLGHISSYLGITQVSLSRIRSEI